jgi:hypothetical protein
MMRTVRHPVAIFIVGVLVVIGIGCHPARWERVVEGAPGSPW